MGEKLAVMVETKTFITQGIVLRASDYQDSNMIVSIFTKEFGLISAKLKGAKNKNTKYKFATLPFCFAQFELSVFGDKFNIESATEIENFFKITLDYEKYVFGSAILEMVGAIALSVEENGVLYSALIKALHTLCFTQLNPCVVFVRFALGIFKITGYEFNPYCIHCGQVLSNCFWEHKSGALVCGDCAGFGDRKVSPSLFEAMSTMVKGDFDKLEGVGEFDEHEAIELVQKNCELHYFKTLNSLKQLL